MPDVADPALTEALEAVAAADTVIGCLAFDDCGRPLAAVPGDSMPDPLWIRLATVFGRVAADLHAVAPLGGVRSLVLGLAERHVAVVDLLPGGGLAVISRGTGNLALLRLRMRTALRALERVRSRASRPAERLDPQPASSGPPLPVRLAELVDQELGEKAGKAREMLRSAGADRRRLEAAVGEVVRFTRLFVDASRSRRLEQRLREALDGEPR